MKTESVWLDSSTSARIASSELSLRNVDFTALIGSAQISSFHSAVVGCYVSVTHSRHGNISLFPVCSRSRNQRDGNAAWYVALSVEEWVGHCSGLRVTTWCRWEPVKCEVRECVSRAGQKTLAQPTCTIPPGAQDRQDVNAAASYEHASGDSARAEKERVGCAPCGDFLGMAHAVLFDYDFVAK